MFPTLPPWEGMHPLIIHFPIALLMVAPVFIIIGLFRKEFSRIFYFSAFVLLLLGALGTVAATWSGEDAEEAIPDAVFATANDELPNVLSDHKELAETTQSAAFGLVIAFAVILLLKRFLKERFTPKMEFIALCVFLVLWIGFSILLVNAAHEGARLVHEFGVRAVMH